ncbi:MAG: hypothetical protein QXI19_14105 [Candidatus Caldarchaeum sp.]
MYLLSHITGRCRLRFTDLYKKNEFIRNLGETKGIKRIETKEGSLTVLVLYEPGSPVEYWIKQVIRKEPPPRASREDISFYVDSLITNPFVKLLWLMAVLSPKRGFLQFAISTQIVNRYIKYKVG